MGSVQYTHLTVMAHKPSDALFTVMPLTTILLIMLMPFLGFVNSIDTENAFLNTNINLDYFDLSSFTEKF